MPFAVTQLDLETIIDSEISQKEKDKYRIISLICGIQKNDKDELIFKAEIESQIQKQIYGYQWDRVSGMNQKIGIDIYMLL